MRTELDNVIPKEGGEPTQAELPRVAVSSCLLGAPVRFDGGHKNQPYIRDVLSQFFQLTPICPEIGVGLGVPRTTIRLIATQEGVRAVSTKNSGLDVTDALRDYAERQVARLGDICGYIVKKGSPSCGMERVKIYESSGIPRAAGSGVYIDTLRKRLPLVPIEEEGRLNDPVLRENFVERVYVLHRWRHLVDQGLTVGRLVQFHARHKMLVLSRDQQTYRALGRLVAATRQENLESARQEYISMLMNVLSQRATRRQHVNVLQHLMGYLKKVITDTDKAELVKLLNDYRKGQIPLIVPITFLKHYFRRFPDPYVALQVYLEPYPEQLALRSFV